MTGTTSRQCYALAGLQAIRSHRIVSRHGPQDFELWRLRVALWLITASALLALYWLAWITDRSLVASADTSDYVAFEQAFPLADALLAAVLLLAAEALWRRRPTAMLWLPVAGGGGIYLLGLDVLYDLQHDIYGQGSAGTIELGINLVTALSSIGVIAFTWRFRRQLLGLADTP